MKPTSRYRKAARSDEHDLLVEDVVGRLEALDFGFEQLCGIADRRGWIIVIARIPGAGFSVHLLTRVARPRTRQWLLTPSGFQIASATVAGTHWNAAARSLWAIASVEGGVP